MASSIGAGQSFQTINPELEAIGSIGFDRESGILIAGMGTDTIDGAEVRGLGAWNGVQWSALGGGLDETDYWTGWAAAIGVLDGSVFIAGSFDGVGGLGPYSSRLARWDGGQWHAFGGVDGWNYRFAVANDEIFLLGGFDTIAGLPIQLLARWNGAGWDDGGMPVPGVNYMKDICWHDGQYYIAGNLQDLPSGAKDIAAWDGAQWQPVGDPGLWGGLSEFTAAESYEGLLFVGGFVYTTGGDVSNIMTWDGAQWEVFHPEITLPYAYVRQMRVLPAPGAPADSVLYAVGGFVLNDWSEYQIMSFDGENVCFSARQPLPAIGRGLDIVGDGDTLYLLTESTVLWSDTVNYLARWLPANGADTCIQVFDGIREITQPVFSLHPNPAIDQLTVTSSTGSDAAVVFTDPMGREVLRSPVRGTTSLDVRSLASGPYLGVLLDAQGNRLGAMRWVKE